MKWFDKLNATQIKVKETKTKLITENFYRMPSNRERGIYLLDFLNILNLWLWILKTWQTQEMHLRNQKINTQIGPELYKNKQ